MASVLAYAPSPRYFATHAYAATKAAAIGLTQSAAAFYADRNIRFNAVAPALIDTPQAARAVGDPQIMQYIASKQPLDGGRVGRPDDVDSAVVYFLSDESRFVTGQVLAVDGGFDHNRQTLRTVDWLEERYPDFRGLNLTQETREGILKHGAPWSHPVSLPPLGAQRCLEGQAADAADEIA